MMDSPCSPCCAEEDIHRCWYCAERCDHCMKAITTQSVTLGGLEESSLQFCSDKCFDLAIKPPLQSLEICLVGADWTLTAMSEGVLQPSIAAFVPCCAAISPKHKKLLHVYVKRKNWAGYCRTDELALCVGWFPEKKLYVVCHARSLTGQILTEFFVSPNLLPGDALPYIPPGEGIEDSLEAIVEDRIVQCSLQKAIDFVMAHDEYDQHYTELKKMVGTGELVTANATT